MQNLISNDNNRGMNEKKQQSQAFREWCSRLGELRALVDEDVPVLCLTATAAASTTVHPRIRFPRRDPSPDLAAKFKMRKTYHRFANAQR